MRAATMASLPSPPSVYTRDALHCADRSSTRASSFRSICRGKELGLSSFSQTKVSSTGRSALRLCRVAARRSPEKRTPAVEEPLEDDDPEKGEYVKPDLPGQERDFWEGPQFELLGFVVQYLWAIGIVIALVGCLLAVRLYNEGASDFRETEVYKDAMESQGFIEKPSDSKVFEEGSSQSAPSAPSVEQESAS